MAWTWEGKAVGRDGIKTASEFGCRTRRSAVESGADSKLQQQRQGGLARISGGQEVVTIKLQRKTATARSPGPKATESIGKEARHQRAAAWAPEQATSTRRTGISREQVGAGQRRIGNADGLRTRATRGFSSRAGNNRANGGQQVQPHRREFRGEQHDGSSKNRRSFQPIGSCNLQGSEGGELPVNDGDHDRQKRAAAQAEDSGAQTEDGDSSGSDGSRAVNFNNTEQAA